MHWLLKTEPDEFSIDDLAKRGREPWTGVRNYQARNHLRAMKRGDEVFVYHSSTAIPGIAGIARVSAEAFDDPTQFDRRSDYFDPKSTREAPRWSAVEVEFVRRLRGVITLEAMKARAEDFEGFPLLARGNRLSVLPVDAAQWRRILNLEPK